MKIAVPSVNNSTDCEIDDRFGRAGYFIIFDTISDNFEYIENTSKEDSSGAGTKTVKSLSELGVEAVITKGEIGPKAWDMITEFELSVYDGKNCITPADAYNLYKSGKLEKIEKPQSGLRRA